MLQNINDQEHINDSNLSNQNTDTLLGNSVDDMVFDNMMFDDSENKETQCMICYEDTDEINWIVFDCKHQICIECLQKLYKNRGKKSILCPFCRNVIEKPINTKEIHNMSFYRRFYLNLSRHPLFCFIFNIFMFFIFIGMIIFVPRK